LDIRYGFFYFQEALFRSLAIASIFETTISTNQILDS